MRRYWVTILLLIPVGLVYYFVYPFVPLDSVEISPVPSAPFVATQTATTSSTIVFTRQKDIETPPDELLFTGDVMLGRFVETLLHRHGSDYLTGEMQPFFQQANRIVVTNFESAMVDPHVHTPNGGFQFSTDAQWLAVLRALNVQYASLANNHSLDFGSVGYQIASKELQKAGVTVFGHPTAVGTTSVTYVPLDNKIIGLIALHTLYSMPNEKYVAEQLKELTQFSDLQIAYVHWGVEYEPIHAARQELLATTLAESGIDLIVGHHPHVVQDIQLVAGVPVVYSLGNFIFDQYFSIAVQEGLLLGVLLQGDQLVPNLYPHESHEALSRPKLMTDDKRQLFLNNLAKRSDATLAFAIGSGQIVLPLNQN